MGRRPPVRKERGMTAREMAEKFGCSVRTAVRAVSLPRDEYLAAHTTNRTKPWEALGMSRATWYRRGKPMPPSEQEQENPAQAYPLPSH